MTLVLTRLFTDLQGSYNTILTFATSSAVAATAMRCQQTAFSPGKLRDVIVYRSNVRIGALRTKPMFLLI